jgi:hypothetical protein
MATRIGISHETRELLDVIMAEWAECRRTIRGFDHIVTHIRSYSILATISLLSVGSFLSLIPEAAGTTLSQATMRGLFIDGMALVLVPFEFYLERHYESYLLASVARACKLEERIQQLVPRFGKIRVESKYGGREGNQMISGLIRYYARHKAGFWKARAHQLLYFFLAVTDASVITITILATTTIGGVVSFVVATIVFLSLFGWIRLGWRRQRSRRLPTLSLLIRRFRALIAQCGQSVDAKH